jgi:pre-mRNA-splicing factor ISY1
MILTSCHGAGLLDWEEAYTNLKAALSLPAESPTPKIPRPNNDAMAHHTDSTSAPANPTKRKAADQDGDTGMSDSTEESSKRSKKQTLAKQNSHEAPARADDTSDPQVEHARVAAAFIPFLAPENLLPPKLPTREEMEVVLLNLRKQALVEEYFGNGEDQKEQN